MPDPPPPPQPSRRKRNFGGFLKSQAVRVNDVVGNLRQYYEYDANNNQTKYVAHTYDKDNLSTLDDDQTIPDQRRTTHYTYAPGSSILTSVSTDTNKADGTFLNNVTFTYAYEKWDAYKQSVVTVTGTNPQSGTWKPGQSLYSYDANGHIAHLFDSQADRKIDYINNHLGQVMQRYQIDHEPTGGDKPAIVRHFYYLNGIGIGDTGTGDVASRIDYAQVLAQREDEHKHKINPYVPQRVFPVTSADFDQNYQPINDNYPAHTPQSYVIRAGDTLENIARATWGDASLWYLIADANGLKGTEQLTPGVRLTLPNVVTNIHNNASTFRPYDPNLALGDTTPTLPDPPPLPSACSSHNRWSVIVAVVIAVVNIIWGNKVQGIMMLFNAMEQSDNISDGTQKKFSWKSYGLSAAASWLGGMAGEAAGAAVGEAAGEAVGEAAGEAAGAAASAAAQTLVTAAVTETVRQGVMILGGQQKKFDWKAVAVSAASSVLGQSLTDSIDGTDWAKTARASGDGITVNVVTDVSRRLLSTAISMLVNDGDGHINWGNFAMQTFGNAANAETAERNRLLKEYGPPSTGIVEGTGSEDLEVQKLMETEPPSTGYLSDTASENLAVQELLKSDPPSTGFVAGTGSEAAAVRNLMQSNPISTGFVAGTSASGSTPTFFEPYGGELSLGITATRGRAITYREEMAKVAEVAKGVPVGFWNGTFGGGLSLLNNFVAMGAQSQALESELLSGIDTSSEREQIAMMAARIDNAVLAHPDNREQALGMYTTEGTLAVMSLPSLYRFGYSVIGAIRGFFSDFRLFSTASKIEGANALRTAGADADVATVVNETAGQVEDTYDLAIGLARHQDTGSPNLLNNFAKKTNSKTYEDVYGTWAFRDYDQLAGNIDGALNKANVIHVNLDGVVKSFDDLPDVVRRGSRGIDFVDWTPDRVGNITNWEIWKIWSDPALKDKSIFYLNGKSLSRP